MRLTIAMEYGITAILYIGIKSNPSLQHPSRYITIEEISQECNLSRNHLTKVIHLLARTDILITFRGRNGGIILGKPLADISLGEVMEALRKTSEVKQVDSFQQDVRQLLKVPLREAEQRYQESMNKVSFADLLRKFKASQPNMNNRVSHLR